MVLAYLCYKAGTICVIVFSALLYIFSFFIYFILFIRSNFILCNQTIKEFQFFNVQYFNFNIQYISIDYIWYFMFLIFNFKSLFDLPIKIINFDQDFIIFVDQLELNFVLLSPQSFMFFVCLLQGMPNGCSGLLSLCSRVIPHQE